MIVDLLSDTALILARSPKVFERGKTYASSGAVSIVGEVGDPEPAIHTEVAGTQIYKTSVWIEDGDAAGSCNRPNADDGWFCKPRVSAEQDQTRLSTRGETPSLRNSRHGTGSTANKLTVGRPRRASTPRTLR